MFKSSAWVLAGAVLATAGLAHAQESPSLASEVTVNRAAVPWYQRFTTSNGLTETITGERENDRQLPQAWSLNQRWGVTVGITEPSLIEHGSDAMRGQQTSVGAYYQFTPSARLGAEVRVEDSTAASASLHSDQRTQPSAGVRVESAFRF
ncbi:MAG: hypothetical protein NW206_02440 [Hyphomonadaceae bacterium]|nr:hypothetical protein [Hyphomonadaceae bacterium]